MAINEFFKISKISFTKMTSYLFFILQCVSIESSIFVYGALKATINDQGVVRVYGEYEGVSFAWVGVC